LTNARADNQLILAPGVLSFAAVEKKVNLFTFTKIGIGLNMFLPLFFVIIIGKFKTISEKKDTVVFVYKLFIQSTQTAWMRITHICCQLIGLFCLLVNL